MNLVHQISQETLTVEIFSEGFGMQEIDLSRSRIDAMINLTVDKALRSLYEEKLSLEKPPVIQTEVSDRIVVAQPLPTVSLLSLSSQAKDVAIRFLQLAAGRWAVDRPGGSHVCPGLPGQGDRHPAESGESENG